MHSIHCLFTGFVVAGTLLSAGETQLLNDGLLSQLRSEAARAHPSVITGKHRAQAAAHDVRSVRLWNDPMVGFGFMGASKMMRMDDGDIMVGLEQALPKPGMFDAERRKMEAMQRADIEKSEDAVLNAGADAVRAAIELALADESITLQQMRIDWMAAMVQNARQIAADPMGSSTDALRMETELAKEQQMLDAARRSREGYAMNLNLVLGRPLQSRWPEMKLPAAPSPAPIAQAEIARIPHANPKVRAMREMAAAANADSQIANRERLPDVAVGVDTQLYSGTGDIKSTTVGIKLSLPWFNDPIYQAKIDASKSRELAAGSDVESMRREIAAMVLMAATEAANAAAQAHAYGGEIHEKARKATQTTEAAWISSKAPLTDLLDSSRTLFSVRLEQRRMIAMQLAALEQLHSLVPNR
jgi:outer membrane protein, heavy metal efflux system